MTRSTTKLYSFRGYSCRHSWLLVSMRVALVHDYLIQWGGAERVLRVLSDLYPTAPIFTLLADQTLARERFGDRRIVASWLQKIPFAARRHRFFPPLMPLAIEQFDFGKYDLVISSSASFAKGIISGPGTLHINYCHTPLRYAWDDAPRYHEEFRSHPSLLRRLTPFFVHYLRVWDRAAAMRPDVFIANSRFVARRIKKYYGREATIIYPPVSIPNYIPNYPENIRDDSGEYSGLIRDEGYFLMVGRLVPYKRFDLAVEVFNELGWPLKIVGTGPEEKRLRKLARNNIELLGYAPEGSLWNLYNNAQALVFPQEEDFGIVAVEAMAAGKPVIAYRGGGALGTVIEGKTGLFFDEQTVPALKNALMRFRTEDFDGEAIRKHTQQFSEERFKHEIQDFIQNQFLNTERHG